MRPQLRGICLFAVVAMVFAALTTSAPASFGAEGRPTPAALDEGLLATDDLLPIFEETDRRALDAQELADETRGPCGGPNTMAHAVALDTQVDVVTAAFGAEAGASLTQDVFSFKNAKQAKAFLNKNTEQAKSCDRWEGVLQGATREFEVSSIRAPELGDKALEVTVVIAPVTPRATGFDGELIRETTYVRVGSVVASLLYLRRIGFRSEAPGAGYPESAVTKLKGAL